MDNRTAALSLISIPGLGPRRIINIKNHFKDVAQVFEASIADLCQIPGIDLGLAKAIKSFDSGIYRVSAKNLKKQSFSTNHDF